MKAFSSKAAQIAYAFSPLPLMVAVEAEAVAQTSAGPHRAFKFADGSALSMQVDFTAPSLRLWRVHATYRDARTNARSFALAPTTTKGTHDGN